MNKKKITKLIAVCMACLGMGVFAFSGCKENGGNNNGTTGGGNHEIGGGGSGSGDTGDKGDGDKNDGEGGSGETGDNGGGTGDGDNQGGGNQGGEDKDPVIKPVAGGPAITKASSGELEAAYVEWTAADNAKWYNVYYSVAGADDWAKLDAPLIRQYSSYFRADAVGLKAGEYDMKVVPVSGEDTEAAEYAAKAEGITVKAHTREGYAFHGGNVPGAYNMDGTLKSGAQVVYVTAQTAKTVKATVNGTEVTGFQAILTARQKKIEQTPLCFRIVGTVNVNDLDSIGSSSEGLQIKGAGKGDPLSNVTIEGIGNDGTINGFGMLIRYSKNVELRNFGIVNFMDDGVSLDTGNSNIWVHNLDFFYGSAGGDSDQAKGDGSLDSKGTDYSTYSYNHFWDSGKCNLLGNGDSETSGEGGFTHLTYHHNWYDHSDSRHPRIRVSTVHIYNNYYDGNSKYGVGATNGSNAFVESNYFRSTATMKPMMISLQGTDIAHGKAGQTFSSDNGGMIKAFGNKFDGKYELITHVDQPTNFDCYAAASRDEAVPSTYKTVAGGTTYSNFDTASDFYEYSPDTADEAKANVERYAGRMGGGDLKWDFDDSVEDSNYGIIAGLKSAVVNYKSSVVKIGNEKATSSGGGTTGGTPGGGNEGGDTPVNPPVTVEGEIVYVPQTDGTTKAGLTITDGSIKTGKGTATIDGVTYNKTLEFDSKVKISFTAPADKDYVLTMYLSVASIKNNGTEAPASAFKTASGYVIYTVTVAKGQTVVLTKKNTTQLFKLVLAPAA